MKSLSAHLLGRSADRFMGVFADTVNDPNSTRKVYLLAGALALLGLLLIAITVWFWHSTRHDPALLAPLETMGQRRFRTLDGGAQQQVLDSARPPDAKPMRWGVVRGEVNVEPEIDLRAIDRSTPVGYEDLRDPAAGSAAEVDTTRDPAPATGDTARDPAPATGDTISGADDSPVEESIEACAVEDSSQTEPEAAGDGTDVGKPHDEQPLVIIPIDHAPEVGVADRLAENRVVGDLAGNDSEHSADDRADDRERGDPNTDVTKGEQRPSIDPLLKMYERNDS